MPVIIEQGTTKVKAEMGVVVGLSEKDDKDLMMAQINEFREEGDFRSEELINPEHIEPKKEEGGFLSKLFKKDESKECDK